MAEIIAWDGGKISKPGIYSGIPIATYHSDLCEGPSISSSGLRAIVNESPADYWDTSYLNPEVEEPEGESAALLIGRAVHHLILGESDFAESFVVQPKTYDHPKDGTKPWSNNAAICKAWHAEQRRAHKTVITDADVKTFMGMAKSLGRDLLVRDGLLNGLVEHSIFWPDKKTGIWLKIRPDTIPTLQPSSVDVCDLKSIMGVDYWDCLNSVDSNGYYQQGALIRQGLAEVLGLQVNTFTLMFAAKKRPFSTRPMMLKDVDMDLGDAANRVGLDVMARCIADGDWPGPGRGPARDLIEYVGLTDFQRERIEGRLQRLRDTFEITADAAPLTLV